MSGSVDEADTMAGIAEKSGACAHAGEMPAFAFDAQLLLDATLLCYQAHQSFGLMSIELIGDKDPGGLWIGVDGLGDVSSKVLIACGWGQCLATCVPVAASIGVASYTSHTVRICSANSRGSSGGAVSQ